MTDLPKRRAAGSARPAITREKSSRKRSNNKDALVRIGTALRLARACHDVTQRELAQRLGVSQNLIWTIESGKKDPGILFLKKIADELEVSFDLFLLAVVDPKKDSPTEKQGEFQDQRNFMYSLMQEVMSKGGKD